LTDLEAVKNPRAFFKKGRVFETSWNGPDGPPNQTARFAVIKPQSTHSIVLPLGTFPDQTPTKYGKAANNFATVVPVDSGFAPTNHGNELHPESLYVKVENPSVTIDPMSRVNLGTPLTVDHNVRVQNIGRVVGDSVKLLDKSYADSLRHTETEDKMDYTIS
jgi:hypothetical protein